MRVVIQRHDFMKSSTLTTGTAPLRAPTGSWNRCSPRLARHPNFRLAHFVRGDLLLARAPDLRLRQHQARAENAFYAVYWLGKGEFGLALGFQLEGSPDLLRKHRVDRAGVDEEPDRDRAMPSIRTGDLAANMCQGHLQC
jgi:hypothetical protein